MSFEVLAISYLFGLQLFSNLKQSLRNSELPLCCKNIMNFTSDLYVKGSRVVREATQGMLTREIHPCLTFVTGPVHNNYLPIRLLIV